MYSFSLNILFSGFTPAVAGDWCPIKNELASFDIIACSVYQEKRVTKQEGKEKERLIWYSGGQDRYKNYKKETQIKRQVNGEDSNVIKFENVSLLYSYLAFFNMPSFFILRQIENQTVNIIIEHHVTRFRNLSNIIFEFFRQRLFLDDKYFIAFLSFL